MKLKLELSKEEYVEFLKLLGQAAVYLDKDPKKVISQASKKRDITDEHCGTMHVKPHANGVIIEGESTDKIFKQTVTGLRKTLAQLPKFKVLQTQVKRILGGFINNFKED